MRTQWSRCYSIPLLLFFGVLLPCTAARIDLNWEAIQTGFSPAVQLATDFDVDFAGDVRDKIMGGGTDAATNAFPNPRVQTTLTPLGRTRVRFFSGSPAPEGGNIPPDPDRYRHFGLTASEELRAREKKWTYDGFSLIIPEVQTSFLFNPSTNQLVVTAMNLTVDTVTMTQAGYLLSDTRFALQDLNRSELPPSVFLSLTQLDGEYLPGQSRSTAIDADPSEFIVTFGSFLFSGASSGNAYTLDASEWAQVNVGETAIPEPATVLPVGLGIAALAAAGLKTKQPS